jgi:hypothetical protein
MPSELGNFREDCPDELVKKMRRFPVSDSRYHELRAELDGRVALRQIDAAKAQVRSARLQVLAVVAMFLAVIATLAAPWLGCISK